jgi:PBS lyase HEAT-like repeat
MQAATALAELGDSKRAANAYDELARDAILYHGDRVEAATALARLKDPRGAALLADMANGIPARHFYSTSRWDLGSRTIARLSDRDAARPSVRLEAAVALAALGDLRAADPLAELVQHYMHGTSQRASEVQAPADPAGQQSSDPLTRLGEISPAGSELVEAARALAGLGDPRGRDRLTELAGDRTASNHTRHLAKDALAELDRSRPRSRRPQTNEPTS